MKFKKKTYSFVFGAADTSKTAAISGITGEVAKIVLTLPAWTNTVTCIASVNNGDSKEIFASAAKNQNAEYAITTSRHECILVGATGEEWKLTLSGVPGGTGGTATLTAYVGE
jgi:hypothetical protein